MASSIRIHITTFKHLKIEYIVLWVLTNPLTTYEFISIYDNLFVGGLIYTVQLVIRLVDGIACNMRIDVRSFNTSSWSRTYPVYEVWVRYFNYAYYGTNLKTNNYILSWTIKSNFINYIILIFFYSWAYFKNQTVKELKALELPKITYHS